MDEEDVLVDESEMTEGRRAQVVLLDERRLEILVQPKLYAGELLDIVSSHFNLKEKEYFGLAYTDEGGHYHWLQVDRRVLEHDCCRKNGTLILHFAVRFFVESITRLRDSQTVELFYLQAKNLVFNGVVDTDTDTAFELAAHVLQASYGDYTDDQTAKDNLKKLPVLPTKTLKEHPSLSYCEEKVISTYKNLTGQTKGSAIVNYMTIVESLPTYGIHYYEVKDKNGLPWWLGLSYKGICQYDYADKCTPRKVFQWKQLENLYFRDKKFSIEVHDPKRLSTGKRTFGGSSVNVQIWFAVTPQLTKCIWSMAISQHQFYLDRKHNKAHLKTVRSLSEIASDLSKSVRSLSSSTSLGNVSNASDISGSDTLSQRLLTGVITTDYQSEESLAAQREMYSALKARKEALEEKLQKRMEELKKLCLQEGELIGELPPETPILPGEDVPTLRRRVGTAFNIGDIISSRDNANEDDTFTSLECEVEIQRKIVSAAQRLCQDPNAPKSVRKQRKLSYQKSHARLKELENKLADSKKKCLTSSRSMPAMGSTGELEREPSEDSLHHIDDGDDDDINAGEEIVINFPAAVASHLPTSQNARDEQQVKMQNLWNRQQEMPRTNKIPPSYPTSSSSSISSASSSAPAPKSLPPSSASSPSKHNISRNSSPSPHRSGSNMPGYKPSSVYQTQQAYRNQQYPTFITRASKHAAGPHMGGDSEVSEVDQGTYRIEGTAPPHVESASELKTPTNSEEFSYPSPPKSLQVGYRRGRRGNNISYNNYGSLERNYALRNRSDKIKKAAATTNKHWYETSLDSYTTTKVDSECPAQMMGSPRSMRRQNIHQLVQQYNNMELDHCTPKYTDSLPRRTKQNRNALEQQDSHARNQEKDNLRDRSFDSDHYGSSPRGRSVDCEMRNHLPGVETDVNRFQIGSRLGYGEVGHRLRLSGRFNRGDGAETSDSGYHSERLGKKRSVSVDPRHTHPAGIGTPSGNQVTTPTRLISPRSENSPSESHKFQNSQESTKPYELSDFYKYSSKVRQQTSREGLITPESPSKSSSSNSLSSGRGNPTSPYQTNRGQLGTVSSPLSSPTKGYTTTTVPSYSAINHHKVSSPSSSHDFGDTLPTLHPPVAVQYTPPKPMKCKAVTPASMNNSNNKSFNDSLMSDKSASRDLSFGQFNSDHLAEAFSEEMLAWYDDQEPAKHKKATLV